MRSSQPENVWRKSAVGYIGESPRGYKNDARVLRTAKLSDIQKNSRGRLRDFFTQRPLNGVLHQFTAILEGQLVFYMGLVRLYRLDAEVQFFRNHSGAVTHADQAEHLELAIGKIGKRRTLGLSEPLMYRCSILLATRSLT